MSERRSIPKFLRTVVSDAGPPLLFLVGVVALWQVAVSAEWVRKVILPPPLDVVTAFFDLMTTDFIWTHIFATTYETVAGFTLAAIFGIGLAVMTGLSRLLRKMLYPYVISLQVTPRIAMAPIIIAWLGFGYSSKVVIAALIAFFPIFINTLTGMLAPSEDEREMFRSLGASRGQTLVNLMVPSSLPIVFAGLKTAMTLALIGAVVGEFISAAEGLGLLVQRFSYQLAVEDAFGVLIILTLLGLILYAVMEYFERVIVFWAHDSRLTARERRKLAKAKRPA